MNTQEIFDRIINGNECFSYRFGEDNEKGYFFINERDENGNFVMCEMCLPHEMTMSSFWRMSERFIRKSIENGTITMYN